MTTAAMSKADEKEAAKAARAARKAEIDAMELKANEGRTGKGTRIAVGVTRGRNPQLVPYESFDESQPDTLPGSLSEFMDLSKVNDEKTIVGYLIDGFNSSAFDAASDPVSEFVELSWPEEVQKQFKIVVNNYAKATNSSIEDSVAIIKPGIVASQAKAAVKA